MICVPSGFSQASVFGSGLDTTIFRGIFINSLLVDVENVAAGSPVGEE